MFIKILRIITLIIKRIIPFISKLDIKEIKDIWKGYA